MKHCLLALACVLLVGIANANATGVIFVRTAQPIIVDPGIPVLPQAVFFQSNAQFFGGGYGANFNGFNANFNGAYGGANFNRGFVPRTRVVFVRGSRFRW